MRRNLSPLGAAAFCSVAAVFLYVLSYFPASTLARDHPECRPFLAQVYRPMPVSLRRQLGIFWWKYASPHEPLYDAPENTQY